MPESIKLDEFDVLGIIEIQKSDIENIEKYVTPTPKRNENGEHLYYSRSKEYYNVKSLDELRDERENLKSLLSRATTKRNFVILENMLNCSAKTYFKKFEEYTTAKGKLKEKYKEEMKEARECLNEDASNMVKLLSGNPMIKISESKKLPCGSENSEKRIIEMDNKAILYLFCNSLNKKDNPENIQVINPGYGSLLIGPFLKATHGYDYTNYLKSKYIDDLDIAAQSLNPRKKVSNGKIFLPNKNLLLIDDNVGTGATLDSIKKDLNQEGIPDSKIKSGGIQYNWKNYYKISKGEKDLTRFNAKDYEILTQLNYAGHKLYEHAVSNLLATTSDDDKYDSYLKQKGYHKDGLSDIQGTMQRGITAAGKAGLQLNKNFNIDEIKEDDFKIPPEDRSILKKEAKEILEKIVSEWHLLLPKPIKIDQYVKK